MSLCASCGLQLSGDAGLCPHGRARRVERRLTDPAHAVAGELDEVVAHDGDVDERLDATRLERRPRQSPERPPVVASHTDPPQYAAQDAEPHTDIRPRSALRVGGIRTAARERVRDL